MKYIVETEFIGHELHVDVEDDSPVMGATREIIKAHLQHGPYKTRKGAENALKSRKKYWRKRGFRHSPRGASSYDPKGNYMFKPWDMDKKTQEKRIKEGWRQLPDHVTFSIEEKVVSKEKLAASRS